PAIIALFLYGASGIVHWIQFFRSQPRAKWILSLPIGMTTMAVGFALRIVFAGSLGKNIYIVMYLFPQLIPLIQPCLFLATDYAILSHLTATFDTAVTQRCLLIRPTHIVKIFVWSDVLTFLLQAAGGSLTTSKNHSAANLGNTIAIVGLVLQAASFGLFTVVLVVFAYRVRQRFPQAWGPYRLQLEELSPIFSPAPIDDWRILLGVVGVTCIGILTRSIFRIVEFSGGFTGTVATHEGYFYAFDALPLWLSMTLYCTSWPLRFVHNRRQSGEPQLELGSKLRSASAR
ncbi:RTA-like protein, partial [Mycena amicta]